MGQAADPGAAGDDAAAQQPVTGDLGVQLQELLAQGEGPRLGEAEPDVVAQRADIGHVVVETFELEQHAARALAPLAAPRGCRASSTAWQ